MRVIAGSARSLPLRTIEGTDTRPTQDRIKETLFNMLQSDIPGCKFLDLYSGSGAIGIEALSRGAAKAVLVENSKKAVECIKDNLTFTKLADKADVMEMDVLSAINRLKGKDVFSIVYMDPPYSNDYERDVLAALRNSDIIDEYHIFDEKSRIKHNYNFRISYLEKSLFELEVLHDDIKNMDTDEYSSSIKSIAPFSETPIYEFKHRFGLRLHKYKEAIKERDAVLICLNEDITELKKNINDLKINLNKK